MKCPDTLPPFFTKSITAGGSAGFALPFVAVSGSDEVIWEDYKSDGTPKYSAIPKEMAPTRLGFSRNDVGTT